MSGHIAKLNKEIRQTEKKSKKIRINPTARYELDGNITEESRKDIIDEQKLLRGSSEEYNREIGELNALGKNSSHLKEETREEKINKRKELENKKNALKIIEDANYRALEKKTPRRTNP